MAEENILENHEIVDVEVNKSDLEVLKECYLVIKEEYSLPDFDDLNEDFSIEKIQNDDTDFLIREVRKNISEKFSGYLRFIETLLSPSNAQMFVFAMLKILDNNDKKNLQTIYKKLAKKEIEVIELDLKYDVSKEADFIKSSYTLWNEVRDELLEMIIKIKDNWTFNGEGSNGSRNYFG